MVGKPPGKSDPASRVECAGETLFAEGKRLHRNDGNRGHETSVGGAVPDNEWRNLGDDQNRAAGEVGEPIGGGAEYHPFGEAGATAPDDHHVGIALLAHGQ